GVGKTALAVHAGHLLLAEYPDAQLYCDLHGVHAPTDPAEVLATMLRALGVSESQLPSGIEERSALFRSLLHGRKVLLVLDNVADEAQVRPLLPGAAGCLTLVTSRSRLSGLAGAHRVPVGVPGQDAAVELLAEIIGRPRVSDEPEHAVELVRACGLLPLAVRIVGNQLVALPDWTLRYLTTR